MFMVVRCEYCGAEYRLKKALFKGAKGACIRCPKCRERIIVESPRPRQVAPPIPQRVTPPVAARIRHRVPPPIAPQVVAPAAPPRISRVAPPVASPIFPPKVPPPAPPAAVETDIPPIRVTTSEGMISPLPRDHRAEGADLSGRIRSEPMAGLDDGIDVSPTPNAVSDPPDIPGRKALRLEEFFIHPSAVEGDRIADGGEGGPMVIRSPGPGSYPPPMRPAYRRPLFLAAVITILLVAGSAVYFADGNSGRRSSGSVLPVRARSAPEHPVFDVGNLKGYLNKNSPGVPFYVVKGTVTNAGKALSNGIRIETTLLGKDNQAIVKNGTFAGNVIDETLLQHMSRVRIEGFLGMRYGDGDVNRSIPAGKTLPFLVVFFDPPEGVESFRVKAIDADEAERVDAPDGKEPGTRESNQQSIRLN